MSPAVRPNVVVVLADDLGWSDLGCYGGEIPTPAIDALAGRGTRMTQFYNTARCSPSRASLLTGLHPHQTGVGVLTRPDLPDGYPGNLDPTVPTMATRLRDAGYRTWLSGKWHLAAAGHDESMPLRRGFERFFGTVAGCSSYFEPQTLHRGDVPATDAVDDPDFYYTDAIATEAVRWIDGHAASDDDAPFFLYLAATAPHWPLHALPADLEAVRGRFDDGWDALRARRLERMAAHGIVDADTRLSDRDPSQPAWSEVEDPAWEVSRMEAYAAQVVALDRAVGRVLDALDRAGFADDTLVVFLADNGASAEELPIGTVDSFRQKDAVMRRGTTRDGRPIRIGNEPSITPGGEDTYASYGVPWANLSNAPLRRYKRWVHEGGISTPFVASWPTGGIGGACDAAAAGTAAGAAATATATADAARIVRDAAQLVDVLPTVLDAAGVPVGDEPVEGRSMLGTLRGEADPLGTRTLYWEHIGNAAVRRGNWKLVRDHPSGWELYDVAVDRTELHDRAADEPTLVAELAAEWQAWADRVGVLDWDAMVARYEASGRDAAAAEE